MSARSPQFEARTVTRFGADGAPLGPPVTLRQRSGPRPANAGGGHRQHRMEPAVRPARAVQGELPEAAAGRTSTSSSRTPARGEIRLSSTGDSRYWELELTGRYLGGERRDLTVSYVRSHGTADLNNYDQFYGNLRNPIVRANEHNLIPTDVPHRVLVRGTIGLPGQWDFAPVIEFRSGFPWSAVDEFQDFVGPRNRAGRLPRVRAFDFSISRPWHVRNHRFRAGIKVYNVFGASAQRDVQNNLGSPEFGQFFNPLERSIGFVLNTR